MQLLEDVKKLLGFTDDVELARHLGKDKSTISKWRSNGEIPPRAEKELTKILLAASPPVPADNCGSCSGRQSHYIEKVAQMMQEMDEDTQKDICLSVEKEKLLRELMRERQEREAA